MKRMWCNPHIAASHSTKRAADSNGVLCIDLDPQTLVRELLRYLCTTHTHKHTERHSKKFLLVKKTNKLRPRAHQLKWVNKRVKIKY